MELVGGGPTPSSFTKDGRININMIWFPPYTPHYEYSTVFSVIMALEGGCEIALEREEGVDPIMSELSLLLGLLLPM